MAVITNVMKQSFELMKMITLKTNFQSFKFNNHLQKQKDYFPTVAMTALIYYHENL